MYGAMNRFMRIGPFHPDLEDGLCEVIAALRRQSTLASIYVLVPTHVLGRHLMRLLARRHDVCFNVRFHTFPDLAEIVGIEALVASKRLPLPPLAGFLIARKAISAKVSSAGYFAPIRESPGTPRSVLASLNDLKKAGLTPQEVLDFANERGSEKLRELATVYAEVEHLRIESGYFDWSERLTMAAREARSSSLLSNALAFCLYGFPELNQLEADFLDACLSGRPGYAFVPTDVAGHTRSLIEWLGVQGFVSASGTDDGSASGPGVLARELFREGPRDHATPCDLRIVSAPGTTQEVEELARRILSHVATPGASFSDVCVLLRHPPAYERTIRDVFASAEIPHVFLEGIPLKDTLSGRLLRLLVRIRRAHYPRADVMEFLGLAPLRRSLLKSFPDASPVDWDRYSREAGIVDGRDQWRRIAGMRRRLEWRIGRLRDETPTPDEPALRRLEHDLRSIQVLDYVLNVLFKRLESIPDRGKLGTLMGGLLRALQSMAALQGDDRAAIQALATATREDVADEEVGFETLARLVEDLLAERLPPTDVYRSGRVVVSSLSAAAGLPFKLVLIPGLVERSFPPPVQQDPVLLDPEREALGARWGKPLVPRVRRAAEERFLFRHALGAASDALVFSYPRLDAATGQVRVPSHYLLRVAEAFTGQAVDYDRLNTLVERIPVGRLASRDDPLSPTEWDLAEVARAIKTRDPNPIAGLPGRDAIVRGTLAETSRWGRAALTEYDGILGVPVPLPPTMAATHLETYGTCPFRFFGSRVLGVREIDEPETVETIGALDRGTLLHEILEKFFAGLVRDGLVPIRAEHIDEYRHRMLSIAQDVFAGFERSGAVGYPFMWEVEKARILTDLEGVLANELANDRGYVPQYFEPRFGPAPSWVKVPPGSTSQPLELTVGGRSLRFVGKIDRIDIGPRQAARVIDYKTGGVYGEKDNRFRGAQSLQLPLYLLAADEMLKHQGIPARAKEALYYYATGRGGYRRIRFDRAALDARFAEFEAILKTIAAGIADGMFPQHPGKGGDNCTWCEFQRVCGQGRVRLAERKADDQRLASLRSMWEIE